MAAVAIWLVHKEVVVTGGISISGPGCAAHVFPGFVLGYQGDGLRIKEVHYNLCKVRNIESYGIDGHYGEEMFYCGTAAYPGSDEPTMW